MKSKSIMLLTVLLTLLAGCKSHKVVTSTPKNPGANIVARVENYNKNVRTFSGKADLTLNSATMGAKASVKAIVDSAMLISIQAFGIMEIGRIYCNRSYILIIDKYHGQYAKYEYASQAKLPISLEAIQGLVLNRYFDPFNVGFGHYQEESDGTNTRYSYTWDTLHAEFLTNAAQQLSRTYFTTTDYKNYGLVEYSQFDANRFPRKCSIKLASPQMIETFTLEYDKAEVNGKVSVDAPSTTRYKKVTLSKLMEDITRF